MGANRGIIVEFETETEAEELVFFLTAQIVRVPKS